MTGKSAAIYTRISEDRWGEAEGVERQKEACEQLAANRGLDVVAYFEDNNRSAMKGKRPAYERLCDAVRASEIDVVIVLRTDRLYRKLSELVPLTEVFRSTPIFAVKSGDVDLTTADGKLRANIMGSVSQHESEVKAERVSDAALQRAHKGRFLGGNRRFGYEHELTRTRALHGAAGTEEIEVPTGKLVHVPAEAEAIRWAYLHILVGGSLRSVVGEWNSRGLCGPRGAAFTSQTVRHILLRPMNAGLACYKGQILEVAHEAPAIIDVETWRAVKSVFNEAAKRAPRGRPATSLLAPVLKCTVCLAINGPTAKAQMCAARRARPNPAGERERIYKCDAAGHVTRRLALLDAEIDALVLNYVRDNAGRLRRPVVSNAKVVKQQEQIETLRNKLAKFAAMAGDMDVNDYVNAVNPLRAQLKELEKAAVRVSGTPATAELLRADDITVAWSMLDTDTKRTIIQENVSFIFVGPAQMGRYSKTMPGVHIYDVNLDPIFPALTAEVPPENVSAWAHAMAAGMPAMTTTTAKRVSSAMFPVKP